MVTPTKEETTEEVDATEEEVATEEEESESESEEGAEEEEESSSTEIDYDAEIEAENKRGKPDLEKAKDAFQKRKEKREEEAEETEEDVDDLDKPMTRREAQEFMAREKATIFKEANADRIKEIATSISESEKEASLIIAIHNNRVWPESLSIKEQLEEAQAIANRKRTVAKTVELARKVQSKETASKDVATTHRDPQKGNAPKKAAQDEAAYKRSGFTYNGTTRRYEKKMPNGKILVKVAGQSPYIAK